MQERLRECQIKDEDRNIGPEADEQGTRHLDFGTPFAAEAPDCGNDLPAFAARGRPRPALGASGMGPQHQLCAGYLASHDGIALPYDTGLRHSPATGMRVYTWMTFE